MRKIGFLAALLSVCLFSAANAHLVQFDDSDVTFTGTGESQTQNLLHDDSINNPQNINKGSLILTVTNSGPETWGDFHFQVVHNIGAGTMILQDASSGEEGAFDPIFKINDVLVSTENYSYDLSPSGNQLDLYFYNAPVYDGDVATFEIFTNNTVSSGLFGVAVWPTPVPEPATLAMLGLGALTLLRRKK